MADDRAAFLDRDGTIIEDVHYLADPEDIKFLDGAIEGLQRMKQAGFKLVVVTNQSGIARGLYSIDEYRAIEARMEERLRAHDVVLSGVFFCPHHPDFTGPCDCRKPGLGMYRNARRNLGVDLAHSFYIGDRLRDVQPALELGGRGILVLTGAGEQEVVNVPSGIEVARDLPGAARLMIEKTRALP
jgi:D-glycero-D-manno-heptose 1,7-bisphosphate phosphatase